MLNIKDITNDSNKIKRKLKTRGIDTKIIDDIMVLLAKRSKLMPLLQDLENKRNILSKQIGFNKSKNEPVENILKDVALIKHSIESIKHDEIKINEDVHELLLLIPNTPSLKTPIGNSEEDNVLIKEYANLGRGKVIDVLPHYDIATKLGIIDFERSVKISGKRFWSYMGDGARLARALQTFFLDAHSNNGYVEIVPPVIVLSKTLEGTGQLPKFKDDLFKIEGKDKWLIPTAEVPLTNFYANEILDLLSPIKLTAYTPCFRNESSSGSKDIKGIIRGFQFNKVEIVKILKSEQLEEEFKKTLNDIKSLFSQLELPYQEIELCTGDLGFSAERTTDLEVWIPSENNYRETSSVSSFGDFQGRRASLKYIDDKDKKQIASTINGSGLAIDRIIAAILENYQNKDGTITIPNVLVKYMGKNIIK
ncbi:serine--tRNA ligase [Candidatus Mycoplasma mahonii]|uniref:serine--tRNA ligase n=1 Tax=Candidatus Mycoplasma mahonii TaxID=3004105 RepID=UPI0026E9233A|nr:serine--tRNA ligase [Candidatus Mycoplasma mahonii]WKX02415.1 serine--tRNA ligase [Candidatus Mycoplasma mahonii]